MFDKYILLSAKNLDFKSKEDGKRVVGTKIYCLPHSISEEPMSLFIAGWHIDYGKIERGMDFWVDFRVKGRNRVEFVAAFADAEGRNSILKGV